MSKLNIIASLAALAFAASASAAAASSFPPNPAGPVAAGGHHYQWDLAHKRCHDEHGRRVGGSFCKSPPRHARESISWGDRKGPHPH